MVISAVAAPTSRRRAAGSTSIWVPIRPPLTTTAGRSSTRRSKTVGYCFFIPTGLHPPRMYPVTRLISSTRIMATDFSPTARAAFFRSSSSATGSTKTKYPPELPFVTRVLKTLSGSWPTLAATLTPSIFPSLWS